MTPYCISFYDGKKLSSFYLTDYKNSQQMLTFAIASLLKRKYNGYKIYVHNLSNFDGIFLLKIFSSIDNIKILPIIKEGKMINIKLSYDNINAYKISFRDSYLILPASLSKLTKQFSVDNKGIFPYNFVNDKFNTNINLNYIGKVPDFKYFINITIDQYNEYTELFNNKSWSLKEETIKYCLQDCISLYQIIDKFNDSIFNQFKLNIHKFPTLPSLAFGIYRAHYLNEYPIPLISGQIFNDISKSFTGGSTDMFKPFGKNLFSYDVNSLYPYVMNNFDMPVGKMKFFEGDILKIDPKAFGFFECKVITPNNLKHPILQTKIDTGQGLRTVSPLGKWTILYIKFNYINVKYTLNNQLLFTFTDILIDKSDLITFIKIKYLI
uniref:Probable DNA polymerase n=1 Tax=Rhizopogon salebrosus TaxID=176626 RepID=A0A4Y5SHQ6_9AGAM|nr:DNA polymerase family B [Rhizopogon salebrosus]QDA23208.1 DNA polymerase family B [Rhizopogon salebrosus]